MNFVSFDFFVFFAVVAPLYFLLRHKWRWILLLAASYFFYAYWNASYLILIIFSTMVDYFVALWIGQTDPENVRRRRLLLSLSILVNLGVLFTFKYFNFFSDSIAGLFTALLIPIDSTTLDLLLPVGISFYTFQSMSYTIDVYRGQLQPERNAGIFATYVSFFPQLVAGPIERATNMLPQFHRVHHFSYARTVIGLRLVLWGFFKKVMIGDRIGMYVNPVYANPENYNGATLILATVFFAFQIYCDFSGYSDIAIGTAKIMGFDLMLNFRQPYFARNVREFWQRWHISLSTWFRDYVYIPLGGNRVTLSRNLVNLMIVFVVSGLWHGAAWTFVMWGFLHGIFICIETVLRHFNISILPKSLNPAIRTTLQIIFTFVLVNIAWIFFRAQSIEQAIYIVTHLLDFSSGAGALAPFNQGEYLLNPAIELGLSFILIMVLIFFDYADAQRGLNWLYNQMPLVIRWGFYYFVAIVILWILFIQGDGGQDFIYFQF